MNKHNRQQNRGFALLLSLIISSIALAIGLSMLQITLKQLTLGSTTRGSEIAFQATNAGMECLRYTRNAKTLDFVAGNTSISLDCLGATGNFTFDGSASPVYRYTYPALNWSPSTDTTLCLDLELFIVDASAAGPSGITYTFPNSGNKTCSSGDVCSYGFVRGYNRSCGEIAGSIFTVQRELTAEF